MQALHGPSSRAAGLRASSSSSTSSRPSRGALQVCCAITREKKEQIIGELARRLDESVIVFGFRYKGLNVQTQQKFRRGVPARSSVYVCKNTLMKQAIKANPKWQTLADEGCSGENAWVFVHEDDIPDAVKHWQAFSGELDKEAKALAPKGVEPAPPTSLSCVVMDGKALSPAEFKRCENLPTKKQLQATIARLLKQPATKIASGVKAVPRKLAYGVRALSELDDDKTKLVGDVGKPKPKEDAA